MIRIYDLDQNNIYSKYKTIKDAFGDYIGKSLSTGARQEGRFRKQFRDWWKFNIANYPEDKRSFTVPELPGEGLIPTVFDKSYPRRAGLHHRFPGRGGLFKTTDQLNLTSLTGLDEAAGLSIDFPELRGIHFFGAYDSSDTALFVNGVVRQAQHLNAEFQNLPFKHLISRKQVPTTVLSQQKTKDAIANLNQSESLRKGLLLVILAIHDIYTTYLSSIFNGGSKAEDAVLKRFNGTIGDSKSPTNRRVSTI